ncbi:ABC transporter substrate-binding protein [Bibersteinia trehalosi]|uniref:ABC transporter substrate-binding protein n=1 Tax=Bibersteinia trehalosi TaxID=47735 RepID=UPI003D29D5AA
MDIDMQREQWSCLVDIKGEVSEWEDGEGKVFLSRFRQVIDYARALFHSRHQNLCFYYQHEQNWYRFTLSLHQPYLALVRCSWIKQIPYQLSERELQILTLLSHGLSNSEIAESLFISNRTVAKHVEHIFDKVGINNRTLLAIFATQHYLYCLPTPAQLEHSILPTFEIEQLVAQLADRHQVEKSPSTSTFLANCADKPITIGIPFVESGLGQIDTEELLNGSQLAVEQINRQGGIHGRKVQLVKSAYQVEEKQSIINAYQQLFDQEVEAICTNYACYLPEVHDLVASEGIPYLHDASHSGSQKSGRIGNIFQVCASSINYGLGVVRFLQAYQASYPMLLKNRRVAIVTVKWQCIDIGMDELVASLRKLNWQVEVVELEKSTNVFQQAMVQLHNIDPTLIVFASYFTEDILNFYAAFIAQPLNAVLYAIYSPSTLQPHQQLCEGVVWATTTGLASTYAGKQFNQLYQNTFGKAPSFSQASLAFDQVNILANVWRKSDYPRHFKQVTQGIRTLVNHGINGSYFFGNEHQIGLTYPDSTTDLSISQPHLIYQIQQGRNTVIAPSLFAESHFKLPNWFELK